jgi:hypothetical protein
MRKASVHRGANTDEYIGYVVARVGMADSKADALAILADIKKRLLGIHPSGKRLKVNNADETKPCP